MIMIKSVCNRSNLSIKLLDVAKCNLSITVNLVTVSMVIDSDGVILHIFESAMKAYPILAHPGSSGGVENKLVITGAEAYVQYNVAIGSEEVDVSVVCGYVMAGGREIKFRTVEDDDPATLKRLRK